MTRPVHARTATESMRHERNRAQRAVKLVDGVFRQNHFESICMSKAAGSQSTRHDVNDLDADEELLTLGDAGSYRWRTHLIIGDRKISFLLDCGATVNLIPASLIRAIGRMKDVRPVSHWRYSSIERTFRFPNVVWAWGAGLFVSSPLHLFVFISNSFSCCTFTSF